MLLTEQDLYTHLYQEVIDEIKREDEDLPEQCISDAEDEAKAYLTRYDLPKLFGTETEAPEVESGLLKNKVKDIACWFLVKKANPNVNLEIFRAAYEDAIKTLEKIMMGKMSPEGWPIKTENGEPLNSPVRWNSNPKRSTHY